MNPAHDPSVVVVREATLEEILQLRHDALRPGMPMADSHQPQDDLRDTWHLAAWAHEVVVACASVSRAELDGEPGWRLRGMATMPDWQGCGCGTLLLRDACRRVVELGDDLLWCNARSSALGFYEKCGFVSVGAEFIGNLGIPHIVAVWRASFAGN